MKLDVGDEVDLRVVHRGVGGITQDDINLAATTAGHRHRLQREAGAWRAGTGRPRGCRHPVLHGDLPGHRRGRGRAQGHAQAGVRRGADRYAPRSGRSSGPPSSATSPAASSAVGEIRRNAKARLLRGRGGHQRQPQIDSLRRFKDDATEVREGFECGIGLGLEQHRGRGHHRDLRDAGEAAHLTILGSVGLTRTTNPRTGGLHELSTPVVSGVRRRVGVGRPVRRRPFPEAEALAGPACDRGTSTALRRRSGRGRARGAASSVADRGGRRCSCGACARCARRVRAAGGRTTRAGAAVHPAPDTGSRRRLAREENAAMADPPRARRLAKRIAQIVASGLEHEVKDPRLTMVTITDAKVTGIFGMRRSTTQCSDRPSTRRRIPPGPLLRWLAQPECCVPGRPRNRCPVHPNPDLPLRQHPRRGASDR